MNTIYNVPVVFTNTPTLQRKENGVIIDAVYYRCRDGEYRIQRVSSA